MATLLTGKEVVESLQSDIERRIAALTQQGVEPTLALVRMGENPDDLSYERTAKKRAETLGVTTKGFVLEVTATQEEINDLIRSINDDDTIHGCLLFRPLPSHINEQEVCDLLSTEKDIDGVSLGSLAAVFTDDDSGFAPCTAEACIKVLEHYDIPLAGKRIAVIGRSLVVGKPVAMMLLRRNATVTLCHSRTEDLEEVCKQADVVICATGRAKAYGAAYFREGQTVIDVGINFDEDGNLCGDVDFEEVEPIVAALTPVPRGVGSVTTAVLMLNTVLAAE